MLNRNALGALAIAGSGLIASGVANATLKLEIDDSAIAGVEVTVNDGDFNATVLNGASTDTVFGITNPGDTQSDTGVIGITTANTTNWSVTTATGLSDAGGTVNVAGAGILDLVYQMTGSGEVSIKLTDTFTLEFLTGSTLLDGNYVLEGGEAAGATVTAKVWDDGVLMSSVSEILNASSGSYSLSDEFEFADADALVSLELIYSTTQGTTLSTTSGDYLLEVSEPTALGLLGLGFAGIGIARRKKAKV